MTNKNIAVEGLSFDMEGTFTLALRLVTGWTYFSAFWRRLILENKLDPDAAGYIGEKFNHFLPNALLIGPGIEYLVSHEQALWRSMLVFTIVEAIVGLLFMLGLFTRLMSIGVFTLALGILLGAGWLGTTCLDEWQIGVLGIAAGFTIFLSGGGRYAIDYYIARKPVQKRWQGVVRKLTSLNLDATTIRRFSLTGAISIFVLTLVTNQYFHGGVWGKLHNLSVKPHITISDAKISGNKLAFTIFRDQGADVYGSFVIAVNVKNEHGRSVFARNADELAAFAPEQIENSYVARVKSGKHSLVVPLGAKARLSIIDTKLQNLPTGRYKIELVDISGAMWQQTIHIN